LRDGYQLRRLTYKSGINLYKKITDELVPRRSSRRSRASPHQSNAAATSSSLLSPRQSAPYSTPFPTPLQSTLGNKQIHELLTSLPKPAVNINRRHRELEPADPRRFPRRKGEPGASPSRSIAVGASPPRYIAAGAEKTLSPLGAVAKRFVTPSPP
jgi:hypothetical protein